jgi:hypothetical protein
MRVGRNARFGFRPSPARQNSNRNKNGFFGISTPVAAPHFGSLRSYPFAQSRKAVRSCPTRMLTLEIAPRRLG